MDIQTKFVNLATQSTIFSLIDSTSAHLRVVNPMIEDGLSRRTLVQMKLV